MDKFKVGDRVEIIQNHCNQGKQGVIVSDSNSSSLPYEIDGISDHYKAEHLKLIKSKKEHSVPLRVGDKVRVEEGGISYTGVDCSNEVGIVEDLASKEAGVMLDSGQYRGLYFPDLTLIPTEADITVGSVWTHKYRVGNVTVRDFKGSDNCPIRIKENDMNGSVLFFLDDCKLIHRGDEDMGTKDSFYGTNGLASKEITKSKTNKKEKKMKTKTITEGLSIIDKACDNLGIVVYFDPESGEVAYKEPNGKHCIGHIDNIQLAPVQVVMPEPKSEKKK